MVVHEPERNYFPTEDISVDDVVFARKLSLERFRFRLVEHFDMMFNRNASVWPTSSIATPYKNSFITYKFLSTR